MTNDTSIRGVDFVSGESGLQRWTGWWAALILGGYYLATSAPGIGWFDAAEWALVINEWGLGHPPGSPGYILLVGLLVMLSPLALPKTLVVCSAFFGALVAVPLDGLLREFGVRNAPARLVWLILGGLLPSIWMQGVRIELYSLSVLLFFCAANTLTQLLREERSIRKLYLLGGFVGFLLSVNPVFGLSIGLVVSIAVAHQHWLGINGFRWSHIIRMSIGGIIGVLPYAYCFIVGPSGDGFIWGDWANFETILFYFSGQDYAVNWAGEPDRLGNLSLLLEYLLLDGSIFVLLFGLGIGWRTGRHRWLWIALLGAGGVLGFFVISNRIFYPEVPDYHGYLVPLIWTLIIGGARGLATMRRAQWSILAGLFVIAAGFIDRPVWSRDMSAQSLPFDFPLAIIESLPANAVYVCSSDHLLFPLMYLQSIGHRTDVVVLNVGFANSAWYWKYLARLHPQTAMPSLTDRMSRSERVRNLFERNPDRSVYVESPKVAATLRLPTCPDSIGIRSAGTCETMDATQTLLRLQGLWLGLASHLDLSKRVIAKYAEDVAVSHLQRGDFSGGMEILRNGVEPMNRPNPCNVDPFARPPRAPKLDAVLIGSSRRNLIHFTALCLQMSSEGS
jgi:hypothetical protein